MNKNKSQKTSQRIRRHARIRAKVSGTAKRPRLSVFKSNRYVSLQLIDDEKGKTLASASSLASKAKTKLLQSKEAGLNLAKVAKEAKVTKVVYDRGGYIYTGRVKAAAEGAREGGLEF